MWVTIAISSSPFRELAKLASPTPSRYAITDVRRATKDSLVRIPSPLSYSVPPYRRVGAGSGVGVSGVRVGPGRCVAIGWTSGAGAGGSGVAAGVRIGVGCGKIIPAGMRPMLPR